MMWFLAQPMIPVLLLLISVILFRIAPSFGGADAVSAMAGWSPLMALALCSGAFFPRRCAFSVGVAAVVVPQIVINLVQGFPVWDANLVLMLAVVAMVACVGLFLGEKTPLAVFLGASVVATVLFHVVSNTLSFLIVEGYGPGLGGWLQAQTTGLPQYTPQTWVFSVKQLIGDLLFTFIFVTACRPLSSSTPTIVPAET